MKRVMVVDLYLCLVGACRDYMVRNPDGIEISIGDPMSMQGEFPFSSGLYLDDGVGDWLLSLESH